MISKQIDEEKFFAKKSIIKKIFNFLHFHSLGHGIMNIWHWLPIIWRDREYDYYNFESILVHKIQFMKKFYESDNCYSMDAPKVVEQMNEVLALFERIFNDNYIDELDPFFHDEFGKITFEDSPDGLTRKMIFPGTDEENAARLTIYQQADANRQADRTKVYALLAQYMEYWWD